MDSLALQAERLCLLDYYRMLCSGDWGDGGEQAVKLSFCRLFLNLPPHIELTYDHAEIFYGLIDQKLKDLGISGMSLADIESELDAFVFQYQGKSYSLDDLENCYEDLRLSESTCVIQGGYYGKSIEFILGDGWMDVFESVQVTTITSEWMRSPSVLIPIAAMISFRHVYIRQLALQSIFYQKWVPFLAQGWMPEASDAVRVSSWIKQRAVWAFENKLLESEVEFVADMRINVLYHELGHAIIQHERLDLKVATLGEGAKMLGPQILLDLLEVLAEVADESGAMRGPLFNMIDISKTNPDHANRLFWTYWSDAWFFDTPDAYMYGYSGLMAVIFYASLNEHFVPDWDKLSALLPQIRAWALDHVRAISLHLESVLRAGEYPESAAQFLEKARALDPPSQSVISEPYLLSAWEYGKLFEGYMGLPAFESVLQPYLSVKRQAIEASLVEMLLGPGCSIGSSLQSLISPYLIHELQIS